jgi:hypothetical protein
MGSHSGYLLSCLSAHQLIRSSTHPLIRSSTHPLINSSAHLLICSSALQPINGLTAPVTKLSRYLNEQSEQYQHFQQLPFARYSPRHSGSLGHSFENMMIITAGDSPVFFRALADLWAVANDLH